MERGLQRAIAVVGLGCTLPDAPDVATFWNNISEGRYSVTDVTPDRWDPNLYYDPDPRASDKAYSKIGGWVRQSEWEPVKWRLPIPPRVVTAMDDAQKWAIACTRQALIDYGYPERTLDLDRTAVILGNAMSGEKHYLTALRLYFPEYARELSESSTFANLPFSLQTDIKRELQSRIEKHFPEITEDSMPGELANCIAGRIANLFNLHGPNFVVDAACASAMAAITAAAEGLTENEFDVAITGGIDRNMGASTFIKFCKIGALSGTGTRPYAEGADGFVMGEGAAIFLLKRLVDAERDKDKIYAVVRGIAGSSDGKGKGITAPNPVGQKLCVERAWKNAALSPATATMIEGHGTSTRVGDVVEVQSFAGVLKDCALPPQSVALGSVKSNFGHLKGAAGAAGLLKTVLCLHNKTLVPSIHCDRPNPDIDFAHTPLYVNTNLKPWEIAKDNIRRAGVSAFGFGGTNFHAVLEEYVPGRSSGNGKKSLSVPKQEFAVHVSAERTSDSLKNGLKAPLRGVLVIGANSIRELKDRLKTLTKESASSSPAAPLAEDLRATERIVIDYGDAAELADKCSRAIKAIDANQAPIWKALRAQGIFRGQGPAAKIAFLYPGQGSQYINMMRSLRDSEAIVRDTFEEADEVMKPLLGKALSEFIFIDQSDPAQVERAESALRQTAITQPAVLACDIAITRMLAAYGIEPDMVMGHSLGEYGALVSAGAMSFKDALEGVSARGREMTRVAVADNGRMAAVFAPLNEIDRILKSLEGYLVIANINSKSQAVIGGASESIERAVEVFVQSGYEAVLLPVSHAFHTSIVAPASEPLRQMLQRIKLRPPSVPVVANVTGEFYPMGADVVPRMIDILGQQIAAPVQFVKGLRTLYDAGARVFVEVGPKKALQGFADDVLGSDLQVSALFTNHPKFPDAVAFNQALCGMYAAGLGRGVDQRFGHAVSRDIDVEIDAATMKGMEVAPCDATKELLEMNKSAVVGNASYDQLGRYFADVLERGRQMCDPQKRSEAEPIVITGAGLGLPGTEKIFDDKNIARLLHGEQFISAVPGEFREAMLDKHITRLVKSDKGEPVFETIHDVSEVIKLAGRGGKFDLQEEYGINADRIPALDRATALAIAAGLDALRDAGIPLVMRYKTTTKGTQLPERWGLADAMRDDTGVIFASAFPGLNSFAEETCRYYTDRARREQLAMLREIHADVENEVGQSKLSKTVSNRIVQLEQQVRDDPYTFDRRFLLRTLSMGHSQFAELIGARGPNTQLNAACASTTQAIAVAEDWISTGRCRRVVIISADDVTSDATMAWFGAGFLASGAAATDEDVSEAAIPFDRRRHGLIVGMGAAALVLESAKAARERGIQPICQVVSAVTANSAFHGTRLDVEHIRGVMEKLLQRAEKQQGISRHEIAPRTVFVSHETYTPARGGSASAEINSLRSVFGNVADQVVIANTKGYTGHAMATGIEDVLAVKTLETGLVPPVANFREVDPELGELNLSRGGSYPVEFALRLGAGFGSQVSMALLRWTPMKDRTRRHPDELGYRSRISDLDTWKNWLASISGKSGAELIVEHRTLRVRDGMAPGVNVAMPAGTESQPVQSPLVIPEKTTSAPLTQKQAPAKPPTSANIKDRVLSLVAEKTGYPVDMLDLDLDLEADLGVDTVKQAEVFAAVREQYGISRDDKLRLRDFPTLAHVIHFVEEKTGICPDAVAEQVKTEGTPQPKLMTQPAQDEDDVQTRVLSLVSEKTGYPIEMLDLDLDMEADLGVDTVKQAEVFASLREIYSIARDPNLKLRDFPTLAHVIRFVEERRTKSTAPGHAAPGLIPTDATVPGELKGLFSRDESVQDRILELVVEKTGYPKEMLDLDLDLEADLGIDTVKQAELFASMRTLYGIERDQNLKLRDFPTLKHVIEFVYQKRPDLAGMAEIAVPAVAAGEAFVPEVDHSVVTTDTVDVKEDEIASVILNIASEKTGYPVDMLALDLDLEADLGVDTVKQAEMFATVRQAFDIPRLEQLKLRDFPTLGHVIEFAKSHAQNRKRVTTVVHSALTESSQKATVRKAGGFEVANKIPRRVPVPSLRPSLALCKRTGVTLDSNSRVVIMPDKVGVAKELEALLRARGISVLMLDRSEDPSPILHSWLEQGPIQGVYWLPGLDDHPAPNHMSEADWQEETRVRAKLLYRCMRILYDSIAADGTFLVSAAALGGQHGYGEVGATAPIGGAVTGFTKAYKRERPDATIKAVDFERTESQQQIAIHLLDETLRDPGPVEVGYKSGVRWEIKLEEQPASQESIPISEHSVFVVTGAAGSIVSAITADLAAASGGTFYLLDLVPEPDPTNKDLQRLTTARESLKRDLFTRIQTRGERATPALVEKELGHLERARAALDAIEAVAKAGGKAHYRSLDLRDFASVSKVVEEVRKAHGRIDALIHAAGMERSHFLPDKEPKEFDLVFDVKADGFFHLLRAVGDMPLGATVVFSSIAGRFGNAGQTDYSAANDLLCKLTSSLRRTHPATQGIAIDWTAWKEIGMASRGSIPKMMELAGIDMIPPEAGVPIARREITSGFCGEVVIAERLGVLLKEAGPESGLDAANVATHFSQLGPMVDSIGDDSTNGDLNIESVLDPTIQPFLLDHRIDGTPVLPGVMGVETFAEAAVSILPEWRVDSIDDIEFSSPFKFYRNEPRKVSINVRFKMNNGQLRVACSLNGIRMLPGKSESQVTSHFTGNVLLTNSLRQQKPPVRKVVVPVEPVVEAKSIYQIYFHGPAYQVIGKAWRDGETMVARIADLLPPNHVPTDRPTVLDPRVLELCLQTAGLWELTVHSRLGLPRHIDHVKFWRTQREPGVALYAVVSPDERHGAFNVEVIDATGDLYCEVSGYRTVTFMEGVDASPLKWLQAVAA